jgi:hypothetical protein
MDFNYFSGHMSCLGVPLDMVARFEVFHEIGNLVFIDRKIRLNIPIFSKNLSCFIH